MPKPRQTPERPAGCILDGTKAAPLSVTELRRIYSNADELADVTAQPLKTFQSPANPEDEVLSPAGRRNKLTDEFFASGSIPDRATIVSTFQNAEGGAYSAKELSRQFDIKAAELHRRRSEYRIVYWREAKRVFLYPRWQFTETGVLLPGIEEILQLFKSRDEWRVMRYFLGTRKQLGGLRPLDLLRADKAEVAFAHAQVHAKENTW